MRILTRREFLNVNKEIDFDDLEVGMKVTLDDTDEPGWYEVVNIRYWMGTSGDFVELEPIDLNEEDEEENLWEDEGYVWDSIVEHGIATEEELKLITGINGYDIDTLNDVIFYRTGYRDLEQYMEYE